MLINDKDTMPTLDKLRVFREGEDGTRRVGLKERMEDAINWMEKYYSRLEKEKQQRTKKRKSPISKFSSDFEPSQKEARREKQVHRSLKQGSKLSQSNLSSTHATTNLDQIVFSVLSYRYGTQSLSILPVSPPKRSRKEVVKPDSITSYQRSSIRNPSREYSVLEVSMMTFNGSYQRKLNSEGSLRCITL